MKNLKKAAGLAVILAFPLLAVTVVMAQGEGNRQGDKNISEAGQANRNMAKPLRATDIKIHKKVPISASEKARLDSQAKKKPPKPDKPGKDKDAMAATGILGELAAGEKYAIVIGICDYPGSTSLDLCQSDGDSLHMYEALTTLYGYAPENIYLFKDMGGITGSNLGDKVYNIPTRDNISNAIMDIKNNPNLTQNDEVTFFFSGHGTTGSVNDGDDEVTDEAIVVWNTGDDTAGDITYIWDGELKEWFNGFATARIAFVFDTCRAGGMNDLADTGRVISMATSETKSAYVYSTAGEDIDGDGISDGEGVFSRYFVNKGMLESLADGYNQLGEPDTVVAVEEAFGYAKNNIPRPLRGRQKPVISDNFTNDLLL